MHNKTVKLIIPLVALVWGWTLPAFNLAAAICSRNTDYPMCQRHQKPPEVMEKQARSVSAGEHHGPCCSHTQASSTCHMAPLFTMLHSRLNGHMPPPSGGWFSASMNPSRDELLRLSRRLDFRWWDRIWPSTTPIAIFLSHQALLR